MEAEIAGNIFRTVGFVSIYLFVTFLITLAVIIYKDDGKKEE